MYVLLTALHIFVALALVLVVLLQTGKGASIGAVFGGAGQTLFGPRGAGNFLSKLTTIAAILFMITSLSLAILSGRRETASVITETTPKTQNVKPSIPIPPAIQTEGQPSADVPPPPEPVETE
jgi:preprotein translocase subunit SecG